MACRTAVAGGGGRMIRTVISTTSIPHNELVLTLLHELDARVAFHVLAIELAHVAVHVRAAGAADRAALADAHAAQRDREHLAALDRIVAGDNDAGDQRVTIVVAIVAELGGGLLDARLLAGLVLVVVERVADNVGNGLRVGRRTAATAVDLVRDARQLVGDAIGNVRAQRCARIGADDDAVFEFHRHDGGLWTDEYARGLECVSPAEETPFRWP